MLKNKKYFVAVLALFAMASCKVEKIKPIVEPIKTIDGTWKVTKTLRNDIDITEYFGMDFSKFRVKFTDGKYTLVDKLPFIVNTGGAYEFDDPQYPFAINFTPDGGTVLPTPFSFPIVNGARTMTFKFSTSANCTTNVYTYTLEKTDEQ